MKYIKTFEVNKEKINFDENFKEPDLRRIGTYVLCIKNSKKFFTKDKYYKVLGFFGDIQGAVEKYGINDYLPVECIYRIRISNDNNNDEYFEIKIPPGGSTGTLELFFDYFEIPEFSDKLDKYNL